MKNKACNPEDILNRYISGFHQYVLTDPIHLSYVSENLCEMIGRPESALLSESEDLYAAVVHPADRPLYAEFIRNLRSMEQTLTLQYRLVKADGTVFYVKDTFTSGKSVDGTPIGYSVLTDITELKNENLNLQFLNETIPCGFLKYTCEKQPKITYINRQMMDFLRVPDAQDGEHDDLDMYKDNIFLMIPMEERRRFALYLNRVYTAGTPIAGEMTVLRCDGTKAYLFGWVTKCTNAQGNEEFQSACMDITARHLLKKERETKRYLRALMDVYDEMFEFDRSNNTVKYLYGPPSPVFKWLENIPMQMADATEKWILHTVIAEDREAVRSFFRNFNPEKCEHPDPKPPQITYRTQRPGGEIELHNGTFLEIEHNVSLYCCRRVPDMQEADALRHENVSLKENMQELVMRFKEGIAAFEVTNDYVTPLYASDNICEYFGYTREEWLPLMKKSTRIRDFVAHSETAYDKFAALLRNGESEFTYYDLNIERERHIKAICSPKSPGTFPRYVLLYNIDDRTEYTVHETGKGTVFIRTFGYFDVFVGDKPIAFRSQKSKELFALLVDRRGGYISSEEAIGFLWEDEPVSPVTLARYRKVALRLKNILEEYGISDVVESIDGKRRIVPERVQCDLYDYLSGKEAGTSLFKGSYLTNYSWGETTLAELTGNGI